MPANLPPQYYKLKHELEVTKTDEVRLQLLEEMLRITPAHKGSEKVISDLRRRAAKLRNAPEKRRTAKHHTQHIPKQGAGQIALIGMPNVGKSQILASCTSANPEVSSTPYSTQKARIGMWNYENIQFQLIDTPPFTSDFVQPQVVEVSRTADLLLLVANLGSDELLDEVEVVRTKLRKAKVNLQGHSCRGDADALDGPNEVEVNQRALIVANHVDEASASQRLDVLRELYTETFEIYPISASTGQGLELLQKGIYQGLEILRVYTKSPGRRTNYKAPLVLESGSSVIEAALKLHKEFGDNFKFARAWGTGWHDGQTVSGDDLVHDGDVLEFHV